MAMLIPVVGEAVVVVPKNGRDFHLMELHKLVDGYIEIVRLNSGFVMIIDEDGKRHERPENPAATALARPYIRFGDVIVGDAVVCTLAEIGEVPEGDDEALADA